MSTGTIILIAALLALWKPILIGFMFIAGALELFGDTCKSLWKNVWPKGKNPEPVNYELKRLTEKTGLTPKIRKYEDIHVYDIPPASGQESAHNVFAKKDGGIMYFGRADGLDNSIKYDAETLGIDIEVYKDMIKPFEVFEAQLEEQPYGNNDYSFYLVALLKCLKKNEQKLYEEDNEKARITACK